MLVEIKDVMCHKMCVFSVGEFGTKNVNCKGTKSTSKGERLKSVNCLGIFEKIILN